MKFFHLHNINVCLVVFTAICFLIPIAYAIDNPDAPDYIGEFKSREKIYLNKINAPQNTSQEYLGAYNDYLTFLDKELNAAYKALISKLHENQQKELRDSQKKWLKFRDSEFKFIVNNWSHKSFGTSAWISRGDYRATVVRERVMQLLHYTLNY